MKTRFVMYEAEGSARAVLDIIEVGDAENRARTRTRLMKQFGKLLDQMLDGSYGCNVISIEREQDA